MSAKEFNVKKLLCDTSDVNKRTREMEGQWLKAMLLRLGVSKIMLKKKLRNEIGNQQWRHYLWDNFFLDVHNDMATGQVKVIKYLDEDQDGRKEVIGEWSKPEVIRMNKKGQRPYCELRLKYWQLV